MKNQLQLIVLLIAGLFGLSATQHASASHFLTADIVYTQLAPATFNVQLNLVRDCNSGGPLPATTDLMISAPGCISSRVGTLNLHPNQVPLNQQCSQLGVPACLLNIVTYSGTITLNASEMTCQEIKFSWSECCRPGLANIQNAQSYSIYTEAMVKVGQNSANSSPGISSLDNPMPMVMYGSEMVYAIAANDPDCDSLSYELVAPLSAATNPMQYAVSPQPAGGTLIMNPCPRPPYGTSNFNGQFAQMNGALPTTFSATYPMPSLVVNWNGPATVPFPGAPNGGMIWAASAEFQLDPASGTLKFTPAHFVHGAPLTANRYLVDVRIKEWRKINGVPTMVGFTRRSILFTVYGGSGISTPILDGFTANGHAISSGQVITIRPGMALNLQFGNGAVHCGPNIPVTISSNAALVLPGAVFTGTSGVNAAGAITWAGSPACSGVKFIQLKVEDDACPVKGYQIHTIGVRVSGTAAVTGLKEHFNAEASFLAYPNPFSHEVKFRFNGAGKANQQLLIYNVLGQLVDQIPLNGKVNGEQEVTWLNAAKFPAGQYVVRFDGGMSQPLKITKLQ